MIIITTQSNYKACLIQLLAEVTRGFYVLVMADAEKAEKGLHTLITIMW